MGSGGELFDCIIQNEGLSDTAASFFFRQCMSAVSYLHQRHICHRDLKPENFLLTKKFRSDTLEHCKVKLIDFGTAKNFECDPMSTKVCTVHYVAPEVLSRSSEP